MRITRFLSSRVTTFHSPSSKQEGGQAMAVQGHLPAPTTRLLVVGVDYKSQHHRGESILDHRSWIEILEFVAIVA